MLLAKRFLSANPLKLGRVVLSIKLYKGVFGCNLELFQSDVDPCFHRRQLEDN